MRGMIYVRLSRTKGEDVSIDRQVAAGHNYLGTRADVEHDCERDDYIEPVGHRSGISATGRPRYRDLIARLNASKNELVWVHDQSRLSRGEARTIIQDAQKRAHEFVIGSKPLNLKLFDDDLNVAANDFVNLMYAMSVSHKQRTRIEEERAAGARMGFPPQGLVFSGRGLHRGYAVRQETYTAADGTTRRFLDTIIAFFREYTRAQPAGLFEISKRLRALGYLWRAKDGSVRPVTLKKLDDITFEHYRGFVDDRLLDAAIARREQRRKHKQDGQKPAPDFRPPLLHRLVFCYNCGRRLYSHVAHRKYYYYKHPNTDCERYGSIRTNKIDEQVLQLPQVQRLMNLTDADKDRIARLATEFSGQPQVDRRKVLEAELNRLEDLAISGLLRKEKFASRRAEIVKELGELKQVAERPRLGYNEYYAALSEMVDNFRNVRDKAPWDAVAIMGSIFSAVLIDVRTGELRDVQLTQGAEAIG